MKSRRQFLQSLGALSVVGLAGCGAPPDPPDSNTTQPANTTQNTTVEPVFNELDGVKPDYPPKNIPANSQCFSEQFSKHPVFVDFGKVTYGDSDGLQLRVSDVDLELGQAFSIGLQNSQETAIELPSKWRFNLQLYTQNGWQEIRWVTGNTNYTKEETTVPPDSGYVWEFYTSTDGLLANHPFREDLRVCPEVQPGRYRFIFDEQNIAVQFEIQ